MFVFAPAMSCLLSGLVPWLPLQGDVAEQGSFQSCTLWKRNICCSDIEIHKRGFARSCVYFCV